MDLREHPHIGARRHPWETARALFFLEVLHGWKGLPAVATVLDVGAGDGWLAGELLAVCPPAAELVCVDPNYTDDWIAASHPARVTLARALPDEAADLVLALDVAEHVEDDAGLLRSIAGSVAPHGGLLFSVPAWPRLFSSHDTALGHHRRYTPANARRLLESVGFAVERSGGLFASLVAPRVAAVALERVFPPRPAPPTSLAWSGRPALTAALEGALFADALVGRWLSERGVALPGLSWWALCSRVP